MSPAVPYTDAFLAALATPLAYYLWSVIMLDVKIGMHAHCQFSVGHQPYYSSVRPTLFAFRATKGKWKEWVLLSKQQGKNAFQLTGFLYVWRSLLLNFFVSKLSYCSLLLSFFVSPPSYYYLLKSLVSESLGAYCSYGSNHFYLVLVNWWYSFNV